MAHYGLAYSACEMAPCVGRSGSDGVIDLGRLEASLFGGILAEGDNRRFGAQEPEGIDPVGFGGVFLCAVEADGIESLLLYKIDSAVGGRQALDVEFHTVPVGFKHLCRSAAAFIVVIDDEYSCTLCVHCGLLTSCGHPASRGPCLRISSPRSGCISFHL